MCTPTQLRMQGWSLETVGTARPITRPAEAITSGSPPATPCLQLLSRGALGPPEPRVLLPPDRVARRLLRHVASARLCRTEDSLVTGGAALVSCLTLRRPPTPLPFSLATFEECVAAHTRARWFGLTATTVGAFWNSIQVTIKFVGLFCSRGVNSGAVSLATTSWWEPCKQISQIAKPQPLRHTVQQWNR